MSTLPLSASGNGLKPGFVLVVTDGAVTVVVAVAVVDESVTAGASVVAKAGKLKQVISNNVAFKIIVWSQMLCLLHYYLSRYSLACLFAGLHQVLLHYLHTSASSQSCYHSS